jgi:hypothetical protein
MDVIWPDAPLSGDRVAAVSAAGPHPADTRRVILCMTGFEGTLTGLPDNTVLLDRNHVDALVSGLWSPADLLDAVFGRVFLTETPLVGLAELLLEQPSIDPPPAMFHPDQMPPKWSAIEDTGQGVAADVMLVGESGWSRPLGLAARQEGRLLVTTEQGLVELDPVRGTTYRVLTLPGCHGAALQQNDGSILVFYRNAVLRLAGPGGQTWVLSGTSFLVDLTLPRSH